MGETLGGKNHKTDVICFATANKLAGNIFGCLEAVRAEVLCKHTGGDVERHNYVGAFGFRCRPAVVGLRTCKNHYQASHSHQAAHKHQVHPPHFPRRAKLGKRRKRGHEHRGMALPAAQHIPHGKWHKHEQQPQIIGMCKRNHFFTSLLSCLSSSGWASPSASGAGSTGFVSFTKFKAR